MKPAWDKLMKNWNKSEKSKTSLIADVDCTADGKSLCDEVGVQGFPTIKWGDPSSLEDYNGGRDYDALKSFAKENLKPLCSPANIDLCDATQKAKIEELIALGHAELKTQVAEKEKGLETAEKSFNDAVQGLQKEYEALEKEKERQIKEIKEGGLGMMKAVLANLAKKKDEL